MRLKVVLLATLHLSTSVLNAQHAAATPVCDFDSDGMSEFLVVNPNQNGALDWTSFNPRSNRSRLEMEGFGGSQSLFIPGNWTSSDQAVAALVDPKGPGALDRATWKVKSMSYLGGAEVSKSLGRPGDIIINGGDFDGNGITDSLILKRTTGMLGLRVNYFLLSYNGDNLGKERLYKALGAPFKDTNFIFSPDGVSDWLAVLQRRGTKTRMLLLKPFTDTPQSFDLGTLPGGVQTPMPLKQGAGIPDLIVFSGARGGQTQITVKNLSGRDIFKRVIPGASGVSVGDYLPDSGWEVAIHNDESITIINPLSGAKREVIRPAGLLVNCISNQIIR